MDRQRLSRLAKSLPAFALLAGLGNPATGQGPPKENKGMKAPVIASLDLGPEIDGMQGRQLRMRMITLEPGGIIAVHSHKDRPTVAYLVQGTWTYLGEGGVLKEYHEGESWAEGKTTTHWAENRGNKPAVALVVDVLKQP